MMLDFNNFDTTLEQLSISNRHNNPKQKLTVTTYMFKDLEPEISIIIPVHNAESVIKKNLKLLVSHAARFHELIIILDDCKDLSKFEIKSFLNSISLAEKIVRAVVIESEASLYETTSDAIGFKLAQSEWLFEVQSDMQIYEIGWDDKLVKHLDQNQDLFCVSARGCHDWKVENSQPKKSKFRWFMASAYQEILGRIGIVSLSSFVFLHTTDFGRCRFRIQAHYLYPSRKLFLGQTVMRGPICFSKTKYNQLGGLNTSDFFLGNDDHELMFRAWKEKKWRCGYVPIKFQSPLEDGATRKPKDSKSENEFQKVASLYPSEFKLSENIEFPIKEVRKLSR